MTTVELLMLLPHYFQLLTIYSIVTRISPGSSQHLSKLQVIFLLISFQLLYHFLVYNRKRWMNHVEEFKGETSEQRAKGTNLIFAYTVGTYVLFFLTLIIVYW